MLKNYCTHYTFSVLARFIEHSKKEPYTVLFIWSLFYCLKWLSASKWKQLLFFVCLKYVWIINKKTTLNAEKHFFLSTIYSFWMLPHCINKTYSNKSVLFLVTSLNVFLTYAHIAFCLVISNRFQFQPT